MDPDLTRVVEGFLEAVRWAVESMRASNIRLPDSNVAWSSSLAPQNGILANGATYYKHGYGIEVRSDTRVVDFDFGDAGETTGFDAWRLANFVQDNRIPCRLHTEDDFRAALTAAESTGALIKRGSLYYLARAA